MFRKLSMVVLGCVLAVAAHAAPRVAVIQSDDLGPYTEPVEAFLEELGEPATVVNLHGRASDADQVAKRLHRERPRVVFALGAKAAWTARQHLPGTPIVYAVVINPERYGIPGRGAVGIEATVSPAQYLSQFVGFFPDVRTVGMLRGPLSTDTQMAQLEETANALGVTLVVESVSSPRRVRPVFNDLATRVDAIWLQPDREMLTKENFRFLTEETRRRRLPLLVETDNMVRAGGLFATVPDPDGLGVQAARLTLEILGGTSVEELSDEYPKKALVVLNMRTVEQAEIPFDPLFLDFVDIVVE